MAHLLDSPSMRSLKKWIILSGGFIFGTFKEAVIDFEGSNGP